MGRPTLPHSKLAQPRDTAHRSVVRGDSAIVMVKDLGPDPCPARKPTGVQIVAFDEALHPVACHRLLESAYSGGQGDVPPFDAWWQGLRSDSEYAADRIFVALDARGEPIGVAQCWTSGFVKDLAVADDWRKRGVGKALLAHVFEAFRQGGFDAVRLKVRASNRPAIALYRSMGMAPEN